MTPVECAGTAREPGNSDHELTVLCVVSGNSAASGLRGEGMQS